MLAFSFLGGVEIRLNGEPIDLSSQPALLLLAYLLLNPRTPHRREKLSTLLWPEAADSNARAYLRQNLWKLGNTLGKDIFDTDKEAIALAGGVGYFFDVDALISAEEHTADNLRAALMHYKGEFLPGHHEDWVVYERQRIYRAYEECAADLISLLENDRLWDEVIEWAEHWITQGNAPEPAYRALMRAHAGRGDLSSVVSVYQRCVQDLERQLNVAPSSKTEELYASLTGAKWTIPTRSPYKGLFAYQEEDAAYFYGRENFTEKLHETILRKPVAAVCGPSGIGKTSVAFAGLVPRAKDRSEAVIITLRPGHDPIKALALALTGSLSFEPSEAGQIANLLLTGELVLGELINRGQPKIGRRGFILIIVDQFEELFSLNPDARARKLFIDQLLAFAKEGAGSSHPKRSVLFLIRSDFLTSALEYSPLAEAFHDSLLTLGPMTSEELRRAVKFPAEMRGVNFDSGLIRRIIDDISDRPGSLPLLGFALSLLWDLRSNSLLTHADYDAIGGVRGALARHAEGVFSNLDLNDQNRARSIFVQLVQPGKATIDTRRMTSRKELSEDLWPLVSRLADERLVVISRNSIGEETVELVHEALINEWQRLNNWMAVDRSFRAWQERLRASLQQWQENKGDDGALLRGASLAEAKRWLEERGGQIAKQESAYIRASSRAEAERDARVEQSRRRVISGLIVGLVIALGLAVASVSYWVKASQNEQAARQAYSLSLAANAQQMLAAHDPVSALAIAIAANEGGAAPTEALRILREAAFAPGARQRWTSEDLGGEAGVPITAVAIAPDGQSALANIGVDGTLAMFDLGTGEIVRTLHGHTAFVTEIVYTPDGDRALSSSEDSTLILWDLATGDIVQQFVGHAGWVNSIDISSDGRYAISGSVASREISIEVLHQPGEIFLWDLTTGAVVRKFEEGHRQAVIDVEFSPDGETILSSSGLRKAYGLGQPAGNVVFWEVATGEVLFEISDLTSNPTDVAISPDGSRALIGSMEEIVYEIDLSTGQLLNIYDQQSDWISNVSYAPDGTYALVSSGDGSLVYWDLTTHAVLNRFHIHDREAIDSTLGPNGDIALSSSVGEVILWDIRNAGIISQMAAHSDAITSLAISSDGSLIATGSEDNSIRIWAYPSMALRFSLQGHRGPVTSIDISPDGDYLVSGSEDGTVRLWHLTTGTLEAVLSTHRGTVQAVVFHPDGHRAYSGSADLTIIEWDLDKQQPLRTFIGHFSSIGSLAIDPLGRFLVASDGASLALWDLGTGEQIKNLYSNEGTALSIEASDVDSTGDLLLTGSTAFSSNVSTWDLQTGENIVRIETGGSVGDVALSPDGQLGLYADITGLIVLFGTTDGRLLWRAQTPEHVLFNALAYHPTENLVLAGSESGTLIIWRPNDMDYPELLAWVEQNRVVRDFSCTEKRLYQIEPFCPEPERLAQIDDYVGPGFLVLATRTSLSAEVGSNRGELALGAAQTWQYAGQAGEVISIYAIPDEPVSGMATTEGQIRPALLLISPDGNLLGANTYYEPPDQATTGGTALLDIELLVSGIYRIEVKNFVRLSSGTYELIIESSE